MTKTIVYTSHDKEAYYVLESKKPVGPVEPVVVEVNKDVPSAPIVRLTLADPKPTEPKK